VRGEEKTVQKSLSNIKTSEKEQKKITPKDLSKTTLKRQQNRWLKIRQLTD
jgi:hypothetical protein